MTNDSGRATITFTPPVVSGPVRVRLVSPGVDTLTVMLFVGVPGLIELPESSQYGLTGASALTPLHTCCNHWGARAMVDSLKVLADSVAARASTEITYNDISLRWGGIFEVGRDSLRWRPPHSWHRIGLDVDIRTHGVSFRDRQLIAGFWGRIGGFVVDEVRLDSLGNETSNSHWHLAVRRNR
ncbi:MAG: penicillin-insensitive murein endopeptidase [Gemmatimonadaceae bacterium]|nr:penicillin-insensitive murein endopeptidase [Gemmatimonadaceae bacterium]